MLIVFLPLGAQLSVLSTVACWGGERLWVVLFMNNMVYASLWCLVLVCGTVIILSVCCTIQVQF